MLQQKSAKTRQGLVWLLKTHRNANNLKNLSNVTKEFNYLMKKASNEARHGKDMTIYNFSYRLSKAEQEMFAKLLEKANFIDFHVGCGGVIIYYTPAVL